MRPSASVAADLREIVRASAARAGDAIVMYGDIVTNTAALEGVIVNPHAGTRIFAGGRRRRLAFRFQARRGRLVSAASPYHAVRAPNGTFLGVLRVVPADLAALATAAERLAPLVDDVPEAWLQELDRKVSRWHSALSRDEEEGGDDFAGPDEPEEADDDAPDADGDMTALSDADETRLRTRVAAAPEDAVALLLVGLVRDHVDITPVYLRRLFWARPLTPEAAARPPSASPATTSTGCCSIRPSRAPTASSRRSSSARTRSTSPAGRPGAGSRPTRSRPCRCCSGRSPRRASRPASGGA